MERSSIRLQTVIGNRAEIDVIWEKWQATLKPLPIQLSNAFGQDGKDGKDRTNDASHPVNPPHPVKENLLDAWEIPRGADSAWPDPAKKLHAEWWTA
jgi:adenine-specific DNA-methyltransferase